MPKTPQTNTGITQHSQRASGQRNDSGIHFDEITTPNFFPGAFEIIDSAIALLESRVNSINEKQKTNSMIPRNDHIRQHRDDPMNPANRAELRRRSKKLLDKKKRKW